MLLRTIYNNDYRPQNLRIQTAKTDSHYGIVFSHMAEMLGREADSSDLNDATAARFARWLMDSRTPRRSAATVNQRLNYLRAIWRWCAKRRIVEEWPTIGNVTEPKTPPKAWTIEQIQKLLASCEKETELIYGVPAGMWWCNLHRWLYQTGERIGATFLLEWTDIDFSRNFVTISAEKRKGSYKGMTYHLSPELTEFLAIQRSKQRPRKQQVFAFPHTDQTAYNIYSRILRRAGLPTDAKSKFHRMRKSFASHLKRAGGDATYALRHTSARITQDCYLDPSICDDKPSHTILPPIE